jgi:hypothetical protein
MRGHGRVGAPAGRVGAHRRATAHGERRRSAIRRDGGSAGVRGCLTDRRWGCAISQEGCEREFIMAEPEVL